MTATAVRAHTQCVLNASTVLPGTPLTGDETFGFTGKSLERLVPTLRAQSDFALE